MILTPHSLNEYIVSLAKSLHTRGFELAEGPVAEVDRDGLVAFSITAFISDLDLATAEIDLDEIWRPLPDGRLRRLEYAYDLIDRPRRRRRAFHLHDRDLAEASLGTAVHEHCEEILGQPDCAHHVGRELPDAHVAIDLLVAAWIEPAELGCSSLICLD